MHDLMLTRKWDDLDWWREEGCGSEEGAGGRSCREVALRSLCSQLNANKNLSTFYSLRGKLCVSQPPW